MPKQVTIPSQHVDAFRVEVAREMSYAAEALDTRIKDGFGSLDSARKRLHAAEILFDQAHAQKVPLVVDLSEALADTLPFIVESEANEMRSDAVALASPEALAAMRKRLDSITFWVEMIESLGDEMIAYTEAGRERRAAEIAEAVA